MVKFVRLSGWYKFSKISLVNLEDTSLRFFRKSSWNSSLKARNVTCSLSFSSPSVSSLSRDKRSPATTCGTTISYSCKRLASFSVESKYESN